MKIKLTNGTELEPIQVTGGLRYVQGANRDALSFIFSAAETTLAELDEIFTADNCQSVTIVVREDEEYIHNGYVIRAELSKTAVEVKAPTAESDAVYEDHITVVMAQRTYAETQLAKLQATVDALTGEQ